MKKLSKDIKLLTAKKLGKKYNLNITTVEKYTELLHIAKPLLKIGDTKKIQDAFQIAIKSHETIQRKSGEDYINHPLDVALIAVKEMGLGPTSIICALLHDVVEDTSVTLDDIRMNFDENITQIIDGLTKINVVVQTGTSIQSETLKKLILTLSKDTRTILIKIADRLHNIRTLSSLPRTKQLKVATETKYIYAPLAHRFGLYAIKSELEDLYLKFADRVTYNEIAEKLSIKKTARENFIQHFIIPIKEKLNEKRIQFQIKGRSKSIFSIWEKMQHENIDFENVYDLCAIRIIVYASSQEEKNICWQVYSIVTDHYKPNPRRIKDWISNPKSNGYESLHTTVMSTTGQWVEVQIRSKRMDDIAERGYAAHWKYKTQGLANENVGLDVWINNVRDVLEGDKTSSIEFIDNFSTNLYEKEVFVFTKQGVLKNFPANSTVLDFAYDIDYATGNQCTGGKVNKKNVSINYQLKHGDQIEVITYQDQVPNEYWINFAMTAKAKNSIKKFFQTEKKEIIAHGQQILEAALKQYNLSSNSKVVEKLKSFFHEESILLLYYKFGQGILNKKQIEQFSTNPHSHNVSTHTTVDMMAHEVIFEPNIIQQKDFFSNQSIYNYHYSLSSCCQPIPFEDILGFVTLNQGIQVHRTQCQQAIQLFSKYGYRIIKSNWSGITKRFKITLQLQGSDRKNLVHDITKLLYNKRYLTLQSIQFTSEKGFFEGKIILLIENDTNLKEVMQLLKTVKNITHIQRVYGTTKKPQ